MPGSEQAGQIRKEHVEPKPDPASHNLSSQCFLPHQLAGVEPSSAIACQLGSLARVLEWLRLEYYELVHGKLGARRAGTRSLIVQG